METTNSPLVQNEDSKVYSLASLYVKKQPHVSYRKVDLNYSISIIHENPKQWITDQFLNKKFHDQNFNIQPKLVISLDDSTLNLSFRDDLVRQNKKPKVEGIKIRCQIHYDGPFESMSILQSKIMSWTDAKETIVSHLNHLLNV